MIRRLAIATLALVVSSGCTERRSASSVESVTFDVAMLPHFSLVLVAQAKGYFQQEGLAVTLRPYAFGQVALSAMLQGPAELATCAETPVVLAELRGERLSVLARISRSTRTMAVIARKDRGISGPPDLAGKRVGVTLGTSGHFFLDTFMLRHAIDGRKVHLVDLKPDAMAGAIERGEVDAVATWAPTTISLQKRFGEKVEAFYVEDLYSEMGVLVARRGFAQRRPEVAKRVLRALFRAEALFTEQPEEARRVVAAVLVDDAEFLDATLRQFQFRIRLGQSLLEQMEEEGAWARRMGLATVDPAPDLLDALEPAPLLAVRPDAVGLVR